MKRRIYIILITLLTVSAFSISATGIEVSYLMNEHEYQISLYDDVSGLIVQISESMVTGYVQTLEGMGPRVTGSSACDSAGTYIYNVFQGLGLSPRYQYWSSGGYSGKNVEGTIEGSSDSDNIYLVCAHYDSVPGSPGADDNAAGTAAVLAAAKVMSDFEFTHTVRFVCFDGEEQGLIGSSFYAQEAASNGDNIVAVLNADMIGYAEDDYDASQIKVYTDGASGWIVGYTTTVAQNYDDLIELDIVNAGYASNSDHYSFWVNGYNAVMYHEYHFNPYYHSPQDTSDKMDMDYDMRVSRLICATLSELSGYISGGGGGGGDDTSIPPVTGYTTPSNYEEVSGIITIDGWSYDVYNKLRWVYVKIGNNDWVEADGLYEWSITWDTTTFEDGEVLIQAISYNGMKQSGAAYLHLIVKNTPDPPPPKIPDLSANGELVWENVSLGGSIEGEFTIENIGDAESELDWEIVQTPDWGEWNFNPNNGFDLTPEDGEITISVVVGAPDEQEQSYSGQIKIVNKEDIDDYSIIEVSLTTPRNREKTIYSLISNLLEKYPTIYQLVQIILKF